MAKKDAATRRTPPPLKTTPAKALSPSSDGAAITEGRQRILVVHHNRSERLIIENQLKKAGYAVSSAASGKGAFRRMQSGPDVVLLAFDLPEMDGPAVLKKIRKEPAGKAVPVIMMMTPDDIGNIKNRDNAFAAGADDYVIIPCSAAELKTKTDHAWDRRQLQQTIESMGDSLEHETTAHTLRESYFRSIIKNAPGITVVLNADGAVAYQSPSAERILGYAPEAYAGKVVWDLVHPDDRNKAVSCLREVGAAADMMVTDDIRVRHKDGSIRYLEVTAGNLLDDPAVLGIVLNAKDITARKQVEATLKDRSEALTERVKELDCLYAIAKIIEIPGITLDVIFQKTVAILPGSWHYPDVAGASIIFDDDKYFSHAFTALKWQQTADLIVNNEIRGAVTVGYTKAPPDTPGLSQHPFLDEEEKLIVAVAERLSRAAERVQAIVERGQALKRIETLLKLNQHTDTPVNAIADFVLEGIVENTQSEFGFIGFMSEDEQQMILHAWSDSAMAQCRVQECPMHFPIAESGIWGEAVRTRQPFFMADYQKAHPAKRGTPPGHVPVRNYLGVPVFEGNRVVAVAGLANRPRPYRDVDAKHAVVLLSDMWKLIQRRRTEFRLREQAAMIEQSADAMIRTDGDFRIVDMNDAAEAMFGWSLADVSGKTPDMFNADPVSKDIQDNIYFTVSAGGVYFGEHLNRRRDGSTFYCQMKISPLHDINGNIYGYMSSQRDVSDRKQAEQAVALTNDILNRLNQKNIKKSFLDNILKRIKVYTGVETVDICLRADIRLPDMATSGSGPDFGERKCLLCQRHLSTDVKNTGDGTSRPGCICGQVLHQQTDPAFDFFSEGGSFWGNTQNHLMQAAALTNGSIAPQRNRHDAGYASVAVIPLFADKTVLGLLQLGDTRPERFSAERIQLLEHIGSLIGIAISRLNAEAAMSNAAREWITTFDAMPEAVALLDKNDRIIRANLAMARLFGYSFKELIGQPCYQCVHNRDTPPEDCLHRQVMKDGKARIQEKYIDRLDKTFSVSVSPLVENNDLVGSIHVMHDISEQKKAEAELQKAQKLESIGLLAGGIAHDFNNILSILWGNIQIISEYMDETDKCRPFLAEAEKSCGRIASLVKQLSTFAKGEAPVKEVTSAAKLIKETTTFMLRGSKTKARFSIADDLPLINIDPSQISQVIENIVINADQAMPSGGIINVDLTTVDYPALQEGAGDRLHLEPGRYLKISIKDQGSGIPEESLPNIFDPYWTTKPHGSGLGLSTCYSIIKQHDGDIQVASTINEGTTVSVYLPVSREKRIKKTPVQTIEPGQGVILVMDDEPRVRETTVAMLGLLGYQADGAVDGHEAVTRYKAALASNQPYDAVILDLTVPGSMGGVDTLKKMLKIDSKVKALVCSGYYDESVQAEYQSYGFMGSVPKPVDMKKLSAELKKILSQNNKKK